MRDAQAAFDALTPAQRTAAACYDDGAAAVAAKYRAAHHAPAGCLRLVTPNPDYFDPKLPRSAPQVVVLWDFARCLTPESIADTRMDGCTVNRTLVETLDWEAVLAWLDR